MNSKVKIGSLTLHCPVMNASGVHCTTKEQYRDLLDCDACGAIVTKTMTLEKRQGNPYPKYFIKDGNSINANGLENYGVDYYLTHFIPGLKGKPVIFSVGGFSNEERIEIIRKIRNRYSGSTESQVGIELNLSCPNVNLECTQSWAAYNAETLDKSLETIISATAGACTFGLKLPPYFIQEQFGSIAEILCKWSTHIDFITCINSIPNVLDFCGDVPVIAANGGYGGYGGTAILPIGLSNVKHFSDLLKKQGLKEKIKIIGCGGITTKEDVRKYFLAGATAVQVGTALWIDGPQRLKLIV